MVDSRFTLDDAVDDIFSLLEPKSLARQVFSTDVDLKKHDLPVFRPDSDYHVSELEIKPGEDTLTYMDQIVQLCKGASHTGKHEKFFSAVMEAFRNAYQHGNKRGANQKINIAYKATADSFEVVIGDQGGKLNANFAPFVLLHRQGLNKPASFYDFAPSAPRHPDNSGIGTYTMHKFSDGVRYFCNENGGLSVQLVVRK